LKHPLYFGLIKEFIIVIFLLKGCILIKVFIMGPLLGWVRDSVGVDCNIGSCNGLLWLHHFSYCNCNCNSISV